MRAVAYGRSFQTELCIWEGIILRDIRLESREESESVYTFLRFHLSCEKASLGQPSKANSLKVSLSSKFALFAPERVHTYHNFSRFDRFSPRGSKHRMVPADDRAGAIQRKESERMLPEM